MTRTPEQVKYLRKIKREAPGVLETIREKTEEHGFNRARTGYPANNEVLWIDRENNLYFDPKKVYETTKKYGPLAREKISTEIAVLAALYHPLIYRVGQKIREIERELSIGTPRRARLEEKYLRLEVYKHALQILYAANTENRDPIETIALALLDPDTPVERYEQYIHRILPFIKETATKRIAQKIQEFYQEIHRS